MCGIVGQVGSEFSLGLPLRLLSHRGPDAQGEWNNGRNCILGHTRLAVLDLNPRANQPMVDPSGRFIVVYNGEIYNFKELKQSYLAEERFITNSDTEVLLLLWRKMGANCLNFLRGMFAFAIWDDKENKLWLARDRFGQKPLVYNLQNGVFTFASELNTLTGCRLSLSINPVAIDLFLGYQFIPAPYTIYEDTFKLPPAHYGVWDGKNLQIKQYWQLHFDEEKNAGISEAEATELLEEKIRESIRYRLRADVPVGSLLSGGVDSSLVTAIAAQEACGRIQTFSIGFKEQKYNELDYANEVAKRYNTDHRYYVLSVDEAEKFLMKSVVQYGEPYGDKSSLPSLMVCELAAKHLKVVLNGDGGDELLAGYRGFDVGFWHRKLAPIALRCYHLGNWISKFQQYFPIRSFMGKRLKKTVKFISPLNGVLSNNSFFQGYERRELYLPDFAESVYGARGRYVQSLLDNTNFDTCILNQLLSIHCRNYFSNDLLVKMDIASMAFGLEARSPLLDHELMELAALFPTNLKIRNGVGKYLLKKIAEKYLPATLLHRTKRGFSMPVREWMRTHFVTRIKDIIADSTNPLWDFTRKDTVATLVRQHEQGSCDHGYRLWLILILGLWLQNQQGRLPRNC